MIIATSPSLMSSFWTGFLSALAVLLIIIIFFALFLQPRLEKLEDGVLYRPDVITPEKGYRETPKSLGLEYEDKWFQNRLHAWYVPLVPGRQALRVILYMHGNGGNIQNTLNFIKYMHQEGFDVVSFDYRGYGESQGIPSEKNLKQDGLDALTALVEEMQYPPDHIILYGHSLGGAVAIDTAVRSPYGSDLAGLVVEGTFSNLHRRALDSSFIFHFLQLKNKYNSLEIIEYVRCPTLIVHSLDDEIIDYYHAVVLSHYLQNSSAPEFCVVPIHGSHNAPKYTPEFIMRLREL